MGNNAQELGRTIAQLRGMGRLEEVDAARLQMARTMARTLDEVPTNAALWREYRAVVKELTADDGGSFDDDLAAMYAESGDSPTP